jgi:hypothetical protein
MVRVDETWEDDHSARVNHAVGGRGQVVRRADLVNHIVAHKQRAIANFAARVIEREKHIGMFEEQGRH